MRALTIEARSFESALGLYQALREFRPDLSGSEKDGYRVAVELGSGDREVITVLNALERHVCARHDGPARLDLDGRSYQIEPGEPQA
jgi:hypothetical protein